MIPLDQLIPLGELGVLFGIWKRLGDLRRDTDRNQSRIVRLRKRLKKLEQQVGRRRRADD